MTDRVESMQIALNELVELRHRVEMLEWAEIKALRQQLAAEREVSDKLERALKLADVQYMGCGGNLGPEEIVVAMRRVIQAALAEVAAIRNRGRVMTEQETKDAGEPPLDCRVVRGKDEAIDRLRGQLQNCVNLLHRLKRHGYASYVLVADEAIESANRALYETLGA